MSSKKGKDKKVVDEFDELEMSYKKNKTNKQPSSIIHTSKNLSSINTEFLEKLKKEKIHIDNELDTSSSSSEEEVKRKKKDKLKTKEKIDFDDEVSSSSSEEEVKRKKKDKPKPKEKNNQKEKKKKIKSKFDNEYSNQRSSINTRPSKYGNYANRMRNNVGSSNSFSMNYEPSNSFSMNYEPSNSFSMNYEPSNSFSMNYEPSNSFSMNYEPSIEMTSIPEIAPEPIVENKVVLEPETMYISQVCVDPTPVENVNQEYRYHDSNVVKLSTSLNIIDYSQFPDSNEESYSLYLPETYQNGKLIDIYNVSNLKLNYYVYTKNIIKYMDYSIIENEYYMYIIENTPKNIKFFLNNDQWIYIF